MALPRTDPELDIASVTWLDRKYTDSNGRWIQFTKIPQWSKRYNCGFVDFNGAGRKGGFDEPFRNLARDYIVASVADEGSRTERLWWYAVDAILCRVDALIAFKITKSSALHIHAKYCHLRGDISVANREYIYMVFFSTFITSITMREGRVEKDVVISNFYLTKKARSSAAASLQKFTLGKSFNFALDHQNTKYFGVTIGENPGDGKTGFFDLATLFDKLKYKYPTGDTELSKALIYGTNPRKDVEWPPWSKITVKDLENESTIEGVEHIFGPKLGDETVFLDEELTFEDIFSGFVSSDDPFTNIVWTMTTKNHRFTTTTRLILADGSACKGTIRFKEPKRIPFGTVESGEMGFFYSIVMRAIYYLSKKCGWSNDFTYFIYGLGESDESSLDEAMRFVLGGTEDDDYTTGATLFGKYFRFSEGLARKLSRECGVECESAALIEKQPPELLEPFIKIYDKDAVSGHVFGSRMITLFANIQEQATWSVSAYDLSMHRGGTSITKSISHFVEEMESEILAGTAANIQPDSDIKHLEVAGRYYQIEPDFFENSISRRNSITLFVSKKKTGRIVSMATFRFEAPQKMHLKPEVGEFVRTNAGNYPNSVEIVAIYTLQNHRSKNLVNSLIYTAISIVMKYRDDFKVGWMVSHSVSPATTRLLTEYFGFNVLIRPNREGKSYGDYDKSTPGFEKWIFEELPLALMLDETYNETDEKTPKDDMAVLRNYNGWNLGVNTTSPSFLRAIETQREKLKAFGFRFQEEGIKKTHEEHIRRKRTKSGRLLSNPVQDGESSDD